MTTDELMPYVGSSEDTARTYSEIAELAGVTRREVEEAVRLARLAGVPLLTGRGVWRTETGAEALSMAERLRERAIHQLLTARAMRETGRRMQRTEARVHQETLFGEAA